MKKFKFPKKWGELETVPICPKCGVKVRIWGLYYIDPSGMAHGCKNKLKKKKKK